METVSIVSMTGSITLILGFVGGVFSYFILKPLNNAILNLQIAVKELRAEVKTNEERRHALEVKLAEVDQSTRSAHHRIDNLESKVQA